MFPCVKHDCRVPPSAVSREVRFKSFNHPFSFAEVTPCPSYPRRKCEISPNFKNINTRHANQLKMNARHFDKKVIFEIKQSSGKRHTSTSLRPCAVLLGLHPKSFK